MIKVATGTPAGTYSLQLNLIDDNADPQEKDYFFDINIEDYVAPEVEFEVVVEYGIPIEFAGVVAKTEDPPSFSLESLDEIGYLKVSFKQPIKVIEDLTEIDDTVFELSLDIDNSNYSDEPTDFEFTWSVVQFEQWNMHIQIEFKKPY